MSLFSKKKNKKDLKSRKPRKKMKIPIIITLYGNKGHNILAQNESHTSDISMTGSSIEMQIDSVEVFEILKDFTPDSQDDFFVSLNVIKPDKTIRLSGTIRWTRIIDFEKWKIQIGASLKALDEETRKEWANIFKSCPS